MDNEALLVLWPVVTGSLIIPVTNWLKMKIPNDFPVGSALISLALSIGSAYLLAQWFAPTSTWKDIITFALGTQVTAQVGHAIVKTQHLTTPKEGTK